MYVQNNRQIILAQTLKCIAWAIDLSRLTNVIRPVHFLHTRHIETANTQYCFSKKEEISGVKKSHITENISGFRWKENPDKEESF